MADITVKTNRIPRPVIDAVELSPDERKEFDYLDWQAIDNGEDSASFFRYKGCLYDLGEFVRIEPGSSLLPYWHGYNGDSYFSGTLVRSVDGGESVIVGRYCC